MKILAIVVTYNGKHWMDKCLGSVISSTIQPDVLVVDNLSTDGTPDYIEKNFSQVKLIRSKQNLGFGRANNIGLKRALNENYNAVLLLNQDAWVNPQTIKKLMLLLQKYPEYGIISPMHLTREEDMLDDKFTQYICRDYSVQLMSDLLLKQKTEEIYPLSFVNAAAWLISRECLQKVGGFDPLFPHYGEDNDYIKRAMYYGYKTGFTPLATIVHDRKGYTKLPDKTQSLEKQYIDHLKSLKDISESFTRNWLFIMKDELFYAFIATLQLKFSVTVVKVRLISRLIAKFKSIRTSRQYCKTTQSAYLYQN